MTAHNGIVVGVDGSPDSENAVVWAAREAIMRDVPLTLAHIRPSARTYTWYELSISEELEKISVQRGAEILDNARAVAERAVAGQGVLSLREHTDEGNAVWLMTDLSKDARMLVVGSRGLGRVGRVLLGSVSASLIRHAHCPVAVIHPREEQPSAQAPVVVGVDGSSASEAAVAVAFDEASWRGVDLVAVHAWSDFVIDLYPADEWTVFEPQAQEVLSERLAGWQERYPDVTVRRVVVRDRPDRQLLQQAASAQLVVVGSHGRGGLTGMLLGSISRRVAESADVPVIVARPE